MKKQSMVWKAMDEEASVKFKMYGWLGRWCALFFGTGRGLFIRNTSYTQHERRTPSPQIDISILLFAFIKQSRGRDRFVVPQCDFSSQQPRPHAVSLVIGLLNNYGWYAFEHPPYSPNLVLSDFHIFLELKNKLGGMRFQSNAEVESWCRSFF